MKKILKRTLIFMGALVIYVICRKTIIPPSWRWLDLALFIIILVGACLYFRLRAESSENGIQK